MIVEIYVKSINNLFHINCLADITNNINDRGNSGNDGVGIFSW